MLYIGDYTSLVALTDSPRGGFLHMQPVELIWQNIGPHMWNLAYPTSLKQTSIFSCHMIWRLVPAVPLQPLLLSESLLHWFFFFFFAIGSSQHHLSPIGGMSQSTKASAIDALTPRLPWHASGFIQVPDICQVRYESGWNLCRKIGFLWVLVTVENMQVQVSAPSENLLIHVSH